MNRVICVAGICCVLFVSCLEKSEKDYMNAPNKNDEINYIGQEVPFVDFTIESHIHENYSGLNIKHRQIINFTNSSHTEELFLFEDPSKRYNNGDENKISEVIVLVYSDRELFLDLKLPIFTLPYDQHAIDTIKASSNSFGVEDRPFFILDTNQNGRDEIFFFVLDGIGFAIVGLEYLDNSIKLILDSSNYTGHLNNMTKKLGSMDQLFIRIVGEGNEDVPSGTRDWYELEWDTARGEYVLSSQGYE